MLAALGLVLLALEVSDQVGRVASGQLLVGGGQQVEHRQLRDGLDSAAALERGRDRVDVRALGGRRLARHQLARAHRRVRRRGRERRVRLERAVGAAHGGRRADPARGGAVVADGALVADQRGHGRALAGLVVLLRKAEHLGLVGRALRVEQSIIRAHLLAVVCRSSVLHVGLLVCRRCRRHQDAIQINVVSRLIQLAGRIHHLQVGLVAGRTIGVGRWPAGIN